MAPMFNTRIKIKELLQTQPQGQTVTVMGWVRSFRNNQFVALNDGSTNHTLQVVLELGKYEDDLLKRITTSASLKVTGTLIESQGKGQKVEVKADQVEILGDSDPEKYPLQLRNRPSLEYLREIAHLRFRTNTFGAVFRVRHALAFAVHQFFNSKGFLYLHTPIITASDAEGAGEMFRVTTLPFDNPPRKEDGTIDFAEDFFGRSTNLTVSGQLEGELGATAFGDIYTFGPTFRAENSNTARHLAEFWMIEPEIAFCELQGLMDVEEDFLKSVVGYVLEHASDELDFLEMYTKTPLKEKLSALVNSTIARVPYREAIDLLNASGRDFEFTPHFGGDIAKEHEKYLTDEHFKSPVFVYDWPKEIKAFYMYQNGDNETVAAVDLLVPGAGELMGGSQRETRYEKLVSRMEELHISQDELYWYLNLRRFGGCEHAGFGMGFERLLIYLTGVENIRDVIPYPRTPQNCEF